MGGVLCVGREGGRGRERGGRGGEGEGARLVGFSLADDLPKS